MLYCHSTISVERVYMSGFPQSIVDQLTSKQVRNLADQLATTFKNVPHLPTGLTQFMASVAPWLVGLGGVFGAFSGIGMVFSGLGLSRSWWMQYAGYSQTFFLIAGILQLVSAGILLLAFSPLRAKKQTGWLLLFCNMGVSVAQSVVGMLFSFGAFSIGSLLWTAIGVMLGLYILYEVRSEFAE